MLRKISWKNDEKYIKVASEGIVISDRLPNPGGAELSYYSDILGEEFKHSPYFFKDSLAKWVPGMDEKLRNRFSEAMFEALEELRLSGKNESVLKNVYIKFMCWLYYHFRKAIYILEGGGKAHIFAYEELGGHEMLWLELMSKIGCEIVLLEGKSQIDELVKAVEKQRRQIAKEQRYAEFFKGKTQIERATNSFILENVFEAVKTPHSKRRASESTYANIFCKINGADDSTTYEEALHDFYKELITTGRKIVVVNEGMPVPGNDEIARIKRKDEYKSREEMVFDLAKNLDFRGNRDLEIIVKKSFVEAFLNEAKRSDISDAKLKSKMVYILCWLRRYEKDMFAGFDFSELPIFIKMAVKTKTEALFLNILGGLPIDVLIFQPNLTQVDLMQSGEIYKINFKESVDLENFPTDSLHRTAAFKAERELDQILYSGSGLYRNRQFEKAETVVISTTFEEIEILWKEAPRFRPGFVEDEEKPVIPTIFAKLSGVPNGDVAKYWNKLSGLMLEDSITVSKLPYIDPLGDNPIKKFATDFYKNGKLLRTEIKKCKAYKYALLREETQDYILEKLEKIISEKLIKGIGENGAEYTVISVVLNLPKEIVRLIQKFDFTKENPKFIYINTGEKMISLEDSIVCLFLNLIGFDVLFAVPTGYQSIENFFNGNFPLEHQIGEYLYDMKMPERLGNNPIKEVKKNWKDFFKRS